MIIHILTRCTRPENIFQIWNSILGNNISKNVNLCWKVIIDTNRVFNIDTHLLSSLESVGVEFFFKKGLENDWGHTLLNQVIDSIDNGWVFILDDDTILHEDFIEILYNTHITHPNKYFFVFGQKIIGKDFTGLDYRQASPENMRIGGVDMGQILINREFLGDHRFVQNNYTADGILFVELYNKYTNQFYFIDQVLSYYNYIQKPKRDSSPKVLFIGENRPILETTGAQYETHSLNVKYDKEISDSIVKFKPDAIITKSGMGFKELCHFNKDIRCKWVNLNTDDNIGNIAYNVAMNSILNPTSGIISYFTPVYNRGKKLIDQYNSLRNQTINNWEWVIVDDSDDKGYTLNVAKIIAEKDYRVKIYSFSEKSGGNVGDVKYRASMLCTGEVIAEFDHDDLLVPTCTETLLSAMNKYPEAGFYYTDCLLIDENWKSMGFGDLFSFGYGAYKEEILMGRQVRSIISCGINPKTIRHIVGVPNHLRAWRRNLYMSMGGHNRGLTICDDYELLVRTFLKTRMVHIQSTEYIQLMHSGNTHGDSMTRGDIQRRVRTISHRYNLDIKRRFEELGIEDWAYAYNNQNPLIAPSRFGTDEGDVSLKYY